MGILAVGSVAFDSVRTPFGYEKDILGGSASYFCVAASYFTDVSMIAVIGDDFPKAHITFFEQKGIDVSGLQKARGRTFRWEGEYGFDMNTARTLDTQLNVFEHFKPEMSDGHRSREYVFLGNIDPDLQRSVLAQMEKPRLVACDTMNYWIENKRESLIETLALVDVLLINDAETRQLAGDPNLVRAARSVLAMGPRTLVVKRGEYGVLMINSGSIFGAPAFPMEEVVDPTGAGDSFAGGFFGYLAKVASHEEGELRRAIVFGSVMASFNVSAFGLKRLSSLTVEELEKRFRQFRDLTYFEDI